MILQFHLGAKTLALLQREFNIPLKWQQVLQDLEEQDLNREALKKLLDDWFGDGNRQVRTAIEQAAAIVFYRVQVEASLGSGLVLGGFARGGFARVRPCFECSARARCAGVSGTNLLNGSEQNHIEWQREENEKNQKLLGLNTQNKV